MVFQWFVSIFVIASGLILFSAWGRAIGAKYWIKTPEHERHWRAFRILVLVALLCEIVLLIISLIGLERTFAWLAAIFLIYFSILFYFGISFFRSVLSTTDEGEGVISEAARKDVSAIEQLATTLRDEGATTAEDLKKAAEEILEHARKVGSSARTKPPHRRPPKDRGGKSHS
jgi:hypothetical protein